MALPTRQLHFLWMLSIVNGFFLVRTIWAHYSVVLNGSGHVRDYEQRGRENRTSLLRNSAVTVVAGKQQMKWATSCTQPREQMLQLTVLKLLLLFSLTQSLNNPLQEFYIF